MRQLLADARQGVVGSLAYAALIAVALVLIGVVGGDVPVWTVGAAILVVLVPAAAIVAGLVRRLDRTDGELKEAQRALVEAREAEADYRQQLDSAGRGDAPVPALARGFVSRINAMRDAIQAIDTTYRSMASDAEVTMVLGLIHDMSETIGYTRVLIDLENVWTNTERGKSLDNLTLTLNQLEAAALEYGRNSGGT